MPSAAAGVSVAAPITLTRIRSHKDEFLEMRARATGTPVVAGF